ncbi:MAG: hypothetical protein BWY02_02658 [bacterium ADurb.Bin157]|nr:MAG: hypothetical protein BWY02_02658 [bacterium ADurb.Bin157]
MRTIVLVISLAMFLVCTCMAETFQGVDFSIIKKTNQANIKGSIEVRLNEKVPKDLLQKLALKLKNDDPQKYDRLFITYYLPGMTSGAGAWATSHFNPGLEVKILGTTIEEEKELKKQTASSSDKVIGEWLDESPYVGAKYTLLKKGNGEM